MRILVTGREGQVARSLVERAASHPGIEVVAAGRPNLALEDPQSVLTEIVTARPDIVVSAAAYTAVDMAEDEPDRARAVNVAGAGAVAAAAAAIDVPVIHLSTDYVFSGDKDGAYVETDPTDPISVYGRTKRDGENAVVEANPLHVILRTAWVYSPFGRNFVKTMLALAENRDTIRVVADQWETPTSALEIADGILHVAGSLHRNAEKARFGIYHLAGSGSTNWSGFASHIFAESRRLGGPFARVEDIATSDYPTRAVRPRNAVLSCEKLSGSFGWTAPNWRTSCRQVVERLLRR